MADDHAAPTDDAHTAGGAPKNAIRAGTLVRVAVLVGATAALVLSGFDQTLTLVLISFVTVMYITADSRFGWELWLEDRGLPSRESWAPVTALAVCLVAGAVDASRALEIAGEKLEIIVFILSFAVVADGLGRSGFFHFTAYRIAERCRGNTTRLILYLVILSSVVTFATSNDIVTLALTPIVVSVCVQARIENTRLLLLSQFIAVNTLATGMLIGSPTNLIVGEALDINFFEYFFIMAVPTTIIFLATFVVIDRINTYVVSHKHRGGRLSKAIFGRWDYSDRYHVPAFSQFGSFTPLMRGWSLLFGVCVAILALVSVLQVSLYWSAGTTVLLAVGYSYCSRVERIAHPAAADRRRQTLSMFRAVPLGIIFFGLSFFVFTGTLVETEVFQQDVLPLAQDSVTADGPRGSLGPIFSTGMAVNVFNDLPTASLQSEVLTQIEYDNGFERVLAIQGVLVGLNLGTYVTPIGALAGLIWFNVIHQEARRLRTAQRERDPELDQELRIPSRQDLIKYGLINFLVVGVVTGFAMYASVAIADVLLRPVDGESLIGHSPIALVSQVLGLVVLIAVVPLFRRVLRSKGVILGHMREVFQTATKVTVFALKHSLLWAIVVGGLFLSVVAGLLYWAETASASLWGFTPQFTSLTSYLLWLEVFIGSGFEQQLFPQSVLGILLSGLVPLGTVAAILYLARIPSKDRAAHLRRRLAQGGIPADRVIILNHHATSEPMVDLLLAETDRFIVLLCDPVQAPRATVLEEHEAPDRLYVADQYPDIAIVDEYSMLTAETLIFLSDGTDEVDLRNVHLLAQLDTVLHRERAFYLDEGTGAELGLADDSANAETGEVRLPKIILEVSSEGMEELVSRSVSDLLSDRIVVVNFDGDVADFLLADCLGDLGMLAQYYDLSGDRLQKAMPAEAAAGTVGVLDRPLALHALPLGSADQASIRRSVGMTDDDTGADGGRLHSTMARSLLEAEVATMDGGRTVGTISLDAMDLLGFSVAVGAGSAHLSVPSAALSLQSETLTDAILLASSDGAASAPPEGRFRVVVVNVRAGVTTFVQRVAEDPRVERVQLVVDNADTLPHQLLDHPLVDVHVLHETDEIVDLLVPRGDRPHERGWRGLRAGDRVYVLAPPGAAADELATVELVKAVDRRIRAVAGQTAGVAHRDVYLAVESAETASRLLLEQFFVDKVFDLQWPRRSFLSGFVWCHDLLYATKDGAPLTDMVEFRRAAQLAAYLDHYWIRSAGNCNLGGGGSLDSLVGVRLDDAIVDVRRRSSPPVQVLGVVRFEYHERNGRIEPGVVPLPRDPSYVIGPEDHVVLMPLM